MYARFSMSVGAREFCEASGGADDSDLLPSLVLDATLSC